MPLTLSLRQAVRIPLELDGITPLALQGRTRGDILRTELTQGNACLPLGDFFSATGSCTADLTVVLEGDLQAVKRIGQGLTSGRMIVRGSAGMHLGAEMSGGVIEVFGDVTDWAGAEMRGGQICVHGSAGDCLGGAYRGSRRGMRGGEIVVDGDAGHELGRVMRRGCIVVAGNVGDFCGSRMIAGSIVIGGAAARRIGAGMKRGTIVITGDDIPELLPTFQSSGEFRPLFLELYRRRFASMGLAAVASRLAGRFERFLGDQLALGLGEILLRRSPA